MDISEKAAEKTCFENMNFEEALIFGNKDELNQLKAWLFKENIRLELEKSNLKEREDKLISERQKFQSEMTEVNHRLVIERQRLKQDELFFDKKMEILKNGFSQLDYERKQYEKNKIMFEAQKDAHDIYTKKEKNIEMAELLFQGVNSHLALKKRYKDLLKIFHPDNLAGDHDMVLIINKIYDELRQDYEMGKQA